MKDLDSIYCSILQRGLVALRNAAFNGDIDWCKAESEHLHNLPSLIGEPNRQRHLYYMSAEKTAYVEWVLKSSRSDVKTFMSTYYADLWRELDKTLDLSQGDENAH